MKHLQKNRSIARHLIASASLLLFPAIALSQGRPNIAWVGGGHSDSVNSIAYSPDGQLLVSGSADRTIKLWRSNGTFIRTLVIPYDINGQLTDVLSVAISPDGTLLGAGVELYHAISQSSFGAVQVWRLSDGTLVRNFDGYGDAVTSVAFSPDGEFIASGSADRSVKVWQLATGTLISNRTDHVQRVNAVAFSPNGIWLASGSDDQTAKLYRTSDWGVERTLTGHTDNITTLAFSPNSANLATAGRDEIVRLWRVIDGNVLFSLPHGSDVYAVAFAADGNTLATGGWDNTIKLWDPQLGLLRDLLIGHTGTVITLAFAPNSKTLASGSWYPEFAIKLWGQRDGARPPRLTNHSSAVDKLVFTADNRLISAGGSTARFWNAGQGRSLGLIDARTAVATVALSPDGQLLALPGLNHTVNIYRASDRVLLRTLVGHTDDITGLAFSHDGSLLASGAFFNGSNDKIKLWNVSSGSVVRELSGQFLFGPFTGINFSSDDMFIAAACEGTPAVWRISDGALIRSFQVIGEAQFSPDGSLLAIGTQPARVYRTSDWVQVATLSDQSQALAFTPDGHHLATAGGNQIQFWRTSDWTLQRFYDEELGYGGMGVKSLAFSLDGTRFAYGRWDALIAVAANPLASKPTVPLGRKKIRGE